MREAAEADLWKRLRRANAGGNSELFEVGGSTAIDLMEPCIVLGGLNGAGKSRLLRLIGESLGETALLIDLHHLSQLALAVLRSRKDFDELTEETGPYGPSDEMLSDIERIIKRDYDSVEWYAIEIEPGDPGFQQDTWWTTGQTLVPYFKAKYRDFDYTSQEMGLGEFSVHLLFWILEQNRETNPLTLLLDEPDALLPPVGVSSLLSRLQNICLTRHWKLILTTHSEEMIALARAEDAFVLLHVNNDGNTIAINCADDPTAGEVLLAQPSITHILFCEDESAFYLIHAILRKCEPKLFRKTSIVWGGGAGDLRAIHHHIPRKNHPEIHFAFVFDGDQRSEVTNTSSPWPTVFLPSEADPDSLFKITPSMANKLAEKLDTDERSLNVFLSSIEGKDPHDWVNDVGSQYGRPVALFGLASLWVDNNLETAAVFVRQLHQGWA